MQEIISKKKEKKRKRNEKKRKETNVKKLQSVHMTSFYTIFYFILESPLNLCIYIYVGMYVINGFNGFNFAFLFSI